MDGYGPYENVHTLYMYVCWREKNRRAHTSKSIQGGVNMQRAKGPNAEPSEIRRET